MKTLKLLPLFFLLSVCAFGQVNIGIYPLATASGTDTYTATVSPAPSAYVSGQRFNIKFTNANTGASTININSLGAKSIVKEGGTALVANDIKANEIKLIVYDGTNMQIISGGSGWATSGNTTVTTPTIVGNPTFSGTVFVSSGNKLGIGSPATPAAPIHVGDRAGTASVDAQVVVDRTISTGTGNAHAFSDGSNISRSGTMGYNSYDARVTFSGTAPDFDHYAGFQFAPTYSATGLNYWMYGVWCRTAITAGTINKNISFYSAGISKTGGTVNNHYDAYFENTNAATNNYSIFAGGRVGIGSNDAPTHQLDVSVSSLETAKTAAFSTLNISNAATSSTASINKTGLQVSSTGTWNGASAKNIGLYVSSVTGGTTNYDAIFDGGGNIGISTLAPSTKLHINGISGSEAIIRFTPFANANFTGIEHNDTANGTILGSLKLNASTGEYRLYAGAGGYFVTVYAENAEKLRVASTQVLVNTDLKFNSAGQGIYIKEGTNATMGTVALVAGTATVSTTKVTANSRIYLTTQTVGGTIGVQYISARTAGTSFTITSTSGTDTSTVAWLIVEPN